MFALVLGVGTACVGGHDSGIPDPPPTSALSSTTQFDLVLRPLAAIPGRATTTTAVIGPGEVTLKGTVVGPDGPLPGAMVRAERLVGDATASADVVTNPDGTWTIPSVLGGRYRVRAWRAPDLALTKPEVFFIEAKGTKELALKVDRYAGAFAQGAIAPVPPIVDEPANLVVQVSKRQVDENGVVRSTPMALANVELVGSGAWRLDGPNPVTSDDGGNASWQVRCRQSGHQPLSATVNGADTFTLALPDCVDASSLAPPDATTSTR
jgi:hypothetical protein